jgi:hypothetical protein
VMANCRARSSVSRREAGCRGAGVISLSGCWARAAKAARCVAQEVAYISDQCRGGKCHKAF